MEIRRDLTVLVRAPLHCPKGEIDRFVQRHEDWIVSHMEKQRKRVEAHPEPTEDQREALGMIETLHRSNRISIDDYIRVKNQLIEYLKAAGNDEANASKEEKMPPPEEMLMYKPIKEALCGS